MFAKILIANRGEIARRIMRTARQLGMRCVAVFVEADAQAPFVAEADEAWLIPSGSYLDIAGLLQIARQSGAEAIHPGYGFLSENVDFARACQAAGVVFIGPGEMALATMGSKSAAKSLLEQHAIPLLPGYHGADQDPARLMQEAERIGYPVLIKACHGGGGKGMRIVERAADFSAALAACQREALASFADASVLLEKYLARARHIELQVFADQAGQCVYLFERDCSIQRRHQKVVEEAPAPGLSQERRQAMGQLACQVARAVQYVGAGTVEFIVDEASGAFYFMEMNTRLQVEHPVTEMITGLDLVEWQLRVAQGEALPLTQAELALRGHAIEVRLYAEDPQHDFLPSCGTLTHWHTPPSQDWLRVDSGVMTGSSISPLFDPMLAKLIAWGETRAEAILRLKQALGQFEIAGVTDNLSFLSKIINHPAFQSGELDTGWLQRSQKELQPAASLPADQALALLALADTLTAQTQDGSAWSSQPGWRLGGQRSLRHWQYQMQGTPCSVTVERQRGECRIHIGQRSLLASQAKRAGNTFTARLDGQHCHATVLMAAERREVFYQGERLSLTLARPWAQVAQHKQDASHLKAPMPGRVVALCTEVGAQVSRGAPLMIMEAMKMEHTLFAPADGTVEAFYFAAGAQVEEGMDLLDFTVQEENAR